MPYMRVRVTAIQPWDAVGKEFRRSQSVHVGSAETAMSTPWYNWLGLTTQFAMLRVFGVEYMPDDAEYGI